MLMAKVKDPKYPILDRRIARAEQHKPRKEKIFVRDLEKSHCDYQNILGSFCYINPCPNIKCEQTNQDVYSFKIFKLRREFLATSHTNSQIGQFKFCNWELIDVTQNRHRGFFRAFTNLFQVTFSLNSILALNIWLFCWVSHLLGVRD